MSLTPPAWATDAACHGLDPNLFFPGRGDNVGMTRAKRVCNGYGSRPACPCRDACLQFALVEFVKWGVFGGTSERERRRLRRELGLIEPSDEAA